MAETISGVTTEVSLDLMVGVNGVSGVLTTLEESDKESLCNSFIANTNIPKKIKTTTIPISMILAASKNNALTCAIFTP